MIHVDVLRGKIFELRSYYDADLDATIIEVEHYFPGEIHRESMTERFGTTTIVEKLELARR